MGNILDYKTISFFDVETTHLDPSIGEIIQIAILTEDSNGNLKEWSTKIKPQLKLGTYSPKALILILISLLRLCQDRSLFYV